MLVRTLEVSRSTGLTARMLSDLHGILVVSVAIAVAVVRPIAVLAVEVLDHLHRSQIPRDGIHPHVDAQHVTWTELRTAFRLVLAAERAIRPYVILPVSPLYQNLATVSVRLRHYASQELYWLHRSQVGRDSGHSEAHAPRSE